jgi:hypothetical protein
MKTTPEISLMWLMCALLSVALSAAAQDNTDIAATIWQHDPGSPGRWITSDNWSHGVPTPHTWAYVNNGGTAVVHETDPATRPDAVHRPDAVARGLFIGGDRGGTVNQISGWMAMDQGLWLGRGRGAGHYNLSDGLFQTAHAFIGSGMFANALPWRPSRFLQTGGASEFSGVVHVGYFPLEIPHPSELPNLHILDTGEEPTDSPDYTDPPHVSALLELGGGRLTAGAMRVGYAGQGAVIQSGRSTAAIRGGLLIGGGVQRVADVDTTLNADDIAVWPYGGGSYRLGNGNLTAGSIHVGDRGRGSFVQTGGSVETEGVLRLGGTSWWPHITETDADVSRIAEILPPWPWPAAGRGSYNLVRGRLATGRTQVGLAGKGIFTQTGGVHRTEVLQVGALRHWPVILDAAGDAVIPNWRHPGVARGTYVMRGGELHAGRIELGASLARPRLYAQEDTDVAMADNVARVSTFRQSGGSVAVEGALSVLGGSYDLADGKLAVGRLNLTGTNVGGLSHFRQSGGSAHVRTTLQIGGRWWHWPQEPAVTDAEAPEIAIWPPYYVAGSGLYELNGGELATGNTHVGGVGRGTFIQTGGAHKVEGTLWVSGTPHWPIMLANAEPVQAGVAIDEAEANVFAPSIWPGPGPARGSYVMRGGRLGAGRLEIGTAYTILAAAVEGESYAPGIPEPYWPWPGAVFAQSGGGVSAESVHLMGGRYVLSGGELEAGAVILTDGSAVAASEFIQSGRSAVRVARLLSIGSGWRTLDPLAESDPDSAPFRFHGSPTYQLRGGALNAGAIQIGGADWAALIQSGGEIDTNLLRLTGRQGTYVIHGGHLNADNVQVATPLRSTDAYAGSGRFGITGRDARITVDNGQLVFGAAAHFDAVEGSRIHMKGADHRNFSRNSDAVGGLANLRMTFTMGPEDDLAFEEYEVAGKDLGFVRAGWEGNFVLNTLALGNHEEVGELKLVDKFDNQPDFVGHEALYLRTLIVGPGSQLDLNGLHLYYLDATLGDGAKILNGVIERFEVGTIPEPATAAVISLGAMCLLAIRKRKK